MKRQITDEEKILIIHKTDKRHIQLIKRMNCKIIIKFKSEDFNRHVPKEGVQFVN